VSKTSRSKVACNGRVEQVGAAECLVIAAAGAIKLSRAPQISNLDTTHIDNLFHAGYRPKLSSMNSVVNTLGFRLFAARRADSLGLFLLLLVATFPAVGASWPARVFAPYVYVGADDNFKLTRCQEFTGQAYYTLAFIIADQRNQPAWDGRFDLATNPFASDITALRQRGGDVIVSFGGEGGQEIARVTTNAAALTANYQGIIDRYQLTWLDFDIEGNSLTEIRTNHFRNLVLAALQKQNPGLRISFTLPVDPQGIPDDGLKLLADAHSVGVKIYSANVMTMDFDSEFLKHQTMAEVSIASALKAREQCQAIDPAIQIGLTPMIGQNDEKSEVFTQADARALLAWAEAQPWVCSVSFWSANRDAHASGRNKKADDTFSGTPQKPWDFTQIFKAFSKTEIGRAEKQ
jgi:chitinase